MISEHKTKLTLLAKSSFVATAQLILHRSHLFLQGTLSSLRLAGVTPVLAKVQMESSTSASTYAHFKA